MGVVLAAVSVLLFVAGAWAVVFGSPVLSVLCIVGALILVPLLNSRRAVLRTRLIAAGVWVAISVSAIGIPLKEVDRRVAALNAKDACAYTDADRIGVWGLNLVMAACGAAPFPEAAVETALLALPRRDSTTIVFRSGFGLRSSVIRGRVVRFSASLGAAPEGSVVEMPRTEPLGLYPDTDSLGGWIEDPRRRWPRDLVELYWDTRCALALNPVTVSAKATRRDGRWLIDIRYRVAVRYADRAAVPLVFDPSTGTVCLTMQERIFWVLQNAKPPWLHPYRAEYRCSVYADQLLQP
jgi:hypothetical protein